MATKSARWFHYTLGTTLVHIIADGFIKRATAFVEPPARPAVWFSRRTTWEPTATKIRVSAAGVRRATLEEMVVEGGVLIRIEVAPTAARITWAHHAKWHESPA